ncbi:MAG: amidohydrolase [Myxococcota bacterium]
MASPWPRSALGLGLLLTLACASPRSGPASGPPPVPSADLVLLSGRIYTLAWPEPGSDGRPHPGAPYREGQWSPDASALAIRGDTLVFVGDDAQARTWIGPKTQVVDLGGAVAVPGLVDAHTHVVEMGHALSRVNLVGVATPEEAVAKLAARADQLPPGQWLFGQGFDEGAWANHFPDKALLDARIPDRPVYVRGLHGFAAWLNQAALDYVKIDSSTPNPTGGKILRDAQGEPTGVVVDNGVELVDAALPQPTEDEIEHAVLAGLEEMARSGFVSVHEAGVTGREIAVLQRLEDEGRLPVRFYAMLRATDLEAMDAYLERGPEIPTEGFLTVRAVKAYYDGSLGARGAALLEDYADRPGHRGTGGTDYAFDAAVVQKMAEAGFQIGIHAIGDAGNRDTLNFLERVGGARPDQGRHRVEHAQVLHPSDLPRFDGLGIIASMQPPHAVEDMPWAGTRLGSARVLGAYAWRTLRTSGAHLVFSSDLPGSDHDIFYGLHAAITRRNKKQEPVKGWFPQQTMSPEEALRGYTSWAAYASFTETKTGVLAPGRWADVTVMTADPLALGESDPGALLAGDIMMTIVAGQVVYDRRLDFGPAPDHSDAHAVRRRLESPLPSRAGG